MMRFTVLPFRHLSASENMAVDAGMSALAAERGEVFFRFYGWSEPAVTFGYSQSFEAAFSHAGDGVAVIRRPSGGGVVDHRADLTYAIAIPRQHAASGSRPQRVYRTVHACLSQAFKAWGVATTLAPCPREPRNCETGQASVCFQRPAPDDVVEEMSGKKLAGAAMRRQAGGLLLQGSISRSAILPMLDKPVWRKDFAAFLADAFDCSPPVTEERWPEALPCPTLENRFRSKAWNAKR